MAKMSGNYETYMRMLRQLREVVLPKQENIKGVVRSLTKGASVALFLIAGVTLFISIVGALYSQLAEVQVDFSSLIRGAFALALSGFGASVTTQGGQLNLGLGGLDTVVTIGAHSGLIFVVAFLTIRRMVRRSSARADANGAALSPIHLAIGFAAFSWVTGFVSQGTLNYVFGSLEIQQLSLTSTLGLFAFSWLAGYRGRVSADLANASGFAQVTQWVSKTLSNFLIMYAVLTIAAIIVAAISVAIDPVFAYASEPVPPSKMDLPQGQIVLVLAGTFLFLINAVFQGLLTAMGLNIGLHLDQTANGMFSLSNLGLSTSKTSFWLMSDVGIAAFVGVLLVVLTVALISGAAAASKTSLTFKSNYNYLQALGYGLFVAFGVTYAMNMQLSGELTADDGTNTTSMSAAVTLGSTFISVLVISTLVLSLSFLASGRFFKFVVSAFPTLSFRIPRGDKVEVRTQSGRIFGITAKLALVAVALTPITAATVNRLWAYTDGPVQVGQKFAENLQKMNIKDLKVYMNPDKSTSLKWLSDKILLAAQPKDGYSTSVKVNNFLKKSGSDEYKPWGPGNLDANVEVTLSKDNKSFVYSFLTDPIYKEPSWLIKHVDYKPFLTPGRLEVIASKYLPKDVIAKITVNGEKTKVGSYFSIPGAYTVKADGFKLIAPTDTTFYSSQYDSLKIGYQVKLPNGASKKLDAQLLAKGKECFSITASGTSKCVNVKKLSSTIVTGEEPTEYFDFRDYGYKSSSITCDEKNRKDALVSATEETSSTKCQAVITFSRDYYKVAKKTVPNYITTEVCSGGYVTPYGDRAYYSYYDDYDYYEDIYEDTNGDLWLESSLDYDDCASTETSRVQQGTRTELIRGAKISTSTMTASSSKTLEVKGQLLENSDFKVTK
jgi:hypothetical protein